jgi:hypothetical protein
MGSRFQALLPGTKFYERAERHFWLRRKVFLAVEKVVAGCGTKSLLAGAGTTDFRAPN